MESSLFGPDVSDKPVHAGTTITVHQALPGAPGAIESVEDVGDPIEAWSRQLVNRWVMLPHQRPDALIELRNLIAAAKARP